MRAWLRFWIIRFWSRWMYRHLVDLPPEEVELLLRRRAAERWPENVEQQESAVKIALGWLAIARIAR